MLTHPTAATGIISSANVIAIMKRTNYLSADVHPTTAQMFYLKEGKVFGNATAFNIAASKVVNRETGEVAEKPAQLRIQIKVRGTTEFNTLDSVTLEQLQTATGKEWTPGDVKLLTGATILYYVSDRVDGQEFYYRPDSIKPAIAPRSGEFTSIFAIEVAPANQAAFDSLPEPVRTIVTTAAVAEPVAPGKPAEIAKSK